MGHSGFEPASDDLGDYRPIKALRRDKHFSREL